MNIYTNKKGDFIMLKGYMYGVNLGHWISQYGQKGEDHFCNYIQESDFKRISDWGFDHVRLPVDYMLFESDENPGVYKEEGLKYVDFAVEMCQKYNINVVLDLHHTPGFTFTNKFDKEKNNLFESNAQQERFINIWRMFTNRYKHIGDSIIFELLNELVLEDSEPWNKLWPKAVQAIKEISPERRIIVGSNMWNSIEHLKHLEIVDDKSIIYNFHCYAPFLFTHQRANWDKNMLDYQTSVTYPLNVEEHKSFFIKNDTYLLDNYKVVGKDQLREFLQPAVDFMKKSEHDLYCGEFGVIANADMDSTLRWLEDIISIFNEHGIGHALWSYRGFSKMTYEDNSENTPYVKAATKKTV